MMELGSPALAVSLASVHSDVLASNSTAYEEIVYVSWR
jgi:hypothetical protein